MPTTAFFHGLIINSKNKITTINQLSYPEMNIVGFVVLAVLLYATLQAKYNYTGQSLTPRF